METSNLPIIELTFRTSETHLLRASTDNLRSRLQDLMAELSDMEDDPEDAECALTYMVEVIGACIVSGYYKRVDDAYFGSYSVTLHKGLV